jgi:hypothetical protein
MEDLETYRAIVAQVSGEVDHSQAPAPALTLGRVAVSVPEIAIDWPTVTSNTRRDPAPPLD